LEWLNLEGSKFKRFPSEITPLTQLKSLLFGPDLLPFNKSPLAQFLQMSNLKELQLVTIGMAAVPIETASHLTRLGFRSSLIESIPFEYRNLTNLLHLHMIYSESPVNLSEFVQFTNLKHLSLSDCEILTIPGQISKLVKLEKLNLNVNKISQVPQTLSKLTDLKVLLLSYNKLAGNIPDTFATLTKLERLYLGRNELSGQIPSYFDNLVHLKTLTLHDNPQLQIPVGGLLAFTVRWKPSLHYRFSFEMRDTVMLLLMIQNSRKRKLNSLFQRLPKDLLLEVFSWITAQMALRCSESIL
jgi:Leucine-rich repeat (LRR) protein